MRRTSSGESKEVQVETHKSLFDYFGKEEADGYVSCDNPIKSRFCERLRAIQAAAMAEGLTVAQALQMVAKNYGWLWNTIPYGRMEEVRIWMKNNAHRYMAIVHKDDHKMIAGEGRPIVAYCNLEQVLEWCRNYKANYDYKNSRMHEADNW